MNRVKRSRSRKPRKYAQMLAGPNPITLGPDLEQLRLRLQLHIPQGQRVPSRQQRRAAARGRL